MGLFSKKTVVCEKCGKEFQVRIKIGKQICDDCLNSELDRLEKVKGYIEYAAEIGRNSYTDDQMEEIVRHRQQILDKYNPGDQGITSEELRKIAVRYKSLYHNEVEDIVRRMGNVAVQTTLGASYSRNFFVPGQFEDTIVDVQDVFAVGYTTNFRSSDMTKEAILCAVFTNDPYIPVFPMVFLGDLGFFAISKSKAGRQGVSAFFELKCPNLRYPVQDLKQLKKQIKADGSVNGALDAKFMLEQISNCQGGVGIFQTKKMSECGLLHFASKALLENNGYLTEDEIANCLGTDRRSERKYWEKQMEEFRI